MKPCSGKRTASKKVLFTKRGIVVVAGKRLRAAAVDLISLRFQTSVLGIGRVHGIRSADGYDGGGQCRRVKARR